MKQEIKHKITNVKSRNELPLEAHKVKQIFLIK